MAEQMNPLEMRENGEYKIYDLNLDSERHVRNHNLIPCKYYSEDEFNLNVKLDNKFSLVHFNCRSLYTNLNKIIDYLNTLKSQFDIIAFSETLLNAVKGYDLGIDGYSLYHVDRPGKRGGGVALCVKKTYTCKIVERMSVAIEGLLECVAVEIELETKK